MIKFLEYARVFLGNKQRSVEALMKDLYIPVKKKDTEHDIYMNAFHLTDIYGLKTLQKIQNHSNAISCFTKITDSKHYLYAGIDTAGGIIIIVSGLLQAEANKDIFTYVDYAGNRWIPPQQYYNLENNGKFHKYMFNFLTGNNYDFRFNNFMSSDDRKTITWEIWQAIRKLSTSERLQFYKKYYKEVKRYTKENPTDMKTGLNRDDDFNEIILSHTEILGVVIWKNSDEEINNILLEKVPIYRIDNVEGHNFQRHLNKLKNKYNIGKTYTKK